ncbi:peptide chain release factor 2 [Clostridium cellulovorans 743B]|uniref:Peptide chain release factor 2 n=1 Tax=Clostridium cellulovorans (strain ATCC 35296 / DSM 3052 / OCM 3 / 743B) TaxID=573061 RepID=D9STI9_CLOC7|nr:peptide chain release factor 2 [Clostridium cellulovorans 743B]
MIELDKANSDIKELSKTIEEMGALLDIPKLTLTLEELEGSMQESGFWDNLERAQSVTARAKGIKDRIDLYNNFQSSVEDIKVLIEMAIEENDSSLVTEVYNEISTLSDSVENLRLELMLSGEYDTNNAIVTLHSGVGGTDAMDWTEMLLRMYTRWCEKKAFNVETLDLQVGDEAGIKSATLKVTGLYAYGYLKAEKGIHRLVRISPFNANGKRQTSFASLEVTPELRQDQNVEINPSDLKVDTYRASGAGGQHVNKTESAIRITHIPTGIVVQCQNERSQIQNRETALNMLKSKLVELKERAHKEKIEDLTGDLKDMGWGSQIRSYVFHPYTMVKDHRTNIQVNDVYKVMDGELDVFIKGYLHSDENKR